MNNFKRIYHPKTPMCSVKLSDFPGCGFFCIPKGLLIQQNKVFHILVNVGKIIGKAAFDHVVVGVVVFDKPINIGILEFFTDFVENCFPMFDGYIFFVGRKIISFNHRKHASPHIKQR